MVQTLAHGFAIIDTTAITTNRTSFLLAVQAAYLDQTAQSSSSDVKPRSSSLPRTMEARFNQNSKPVLRSHDVASGIRSSAWMSG